MTGPGQTPDGGPRRFVIAAGCGVYDNLPDDFQLEGVPDELAGIVALAVGWGYERVLEEVSLNPDVETVRSVFADWLTATDRRSDDVVIVYWTGHGLGDAEWQDHRLLARNSEDDKRHTTWRAADWVEALADSPVRDVLLIIDACYAGLAGPRLASAASKLATTAPRTRSGGGLVVMSSARAKEEATQSAFTDALAAAVSEAPAGFKQEWLDLLQLAKTMNVRLSEHQHVEVSAFARGEPPAFVPNPNFGATLALPDDLLTHWDPRGRGVGLAADQGRYFTGRRAVLAEIASWLNLPGEVGTSVRVVTGGPGSGKSAVLAQFVTPPADGASGSGRPTVDVAVVARNKTPLAVGAELAGELLSVDTARLGSDLAVLVTQLASHVSRHEAITTIAVDAVDEATDPRVVYWELLRPLVQAVRAAGDRPGELRLLVGSRKKEADLFAPIAGLLDLDDDRYIDENDLAEYVHKVLTTDRLPGTAHYPPEAGEGSGWQIARAVARKASPNFLIARLVALSIRDAPEPVDTTKPDWQEVFPGTVGEVFDAWLVRLGPDEQRVRDLLEPLAYAAGAGIPWGGVWAPIASATSGRDYTDSDIRWLIEGPAKSYLTESQVHDQSVYRLYHQALADHLHDPARARDVHLRIVSVLLDGAPTDQDDVITWDSAHQYLSDHLAEHAATADDGTLDRLLTDGGYLLSAAPATLLGVLHAARSEEARRAANAYREVANRMGSDPEPETLAHFRLAALQSHAHGLADSLDTIPHNEGSWYPTWAWWRRPIPSRVVTTFPSRANVLAALDTSHGPIAVVGGQFGIQVWDIGTAKRLGTSPDPVDILTVGLGAGQGHVLASHDDGTVVVYALPSLEVLGHARSPHDKILTACQIGDSHVGTGGSEGSIALWRLPDLAPIKSRIRAHTMVRALAAANLAGKPVVVSGGDTVEENGRLVTDLPALRLWSVPDLRPIAHYANHGIVQGVGIVSSGSECIVLLSSGFDGKILRVKPDGAVIPLGAFDGHCDTVLTLEPSPNPELLVWGYGVIRVVTVAQEPSGESAQVGSEVEIDGLTSGPVGLGHDRVVVSAGRKLRLWDPTDIVVSSGESPPLGEVQAKGSIAILSGSTDMISALTGVIGAGDVRRWHWPSGDELPEIRQRSRNIIGLSNCDLDGRTHTVVAYSNGIIEAFDWRDSQWEHPIDAKTDLSQVAIWSAGHRPLLVASVALEPGPSPWDRQEHVLRLWDLETGQELDTRLEAVLFVQAARREHGLPSGSPAAVYRFTLMDHKPISHVGFFGNARRAYVYAASSRTLAAWSLKDYEQVLQVPLRDTRAAIQGTSTRLLASNYKGEIANLLEANGRSIIATHPMVKSLLLAKWCGEEALLSGGQDNHLRVWRLGGAMVDAIDLGDSIRTLCHLPEGDVGIGTNRGIVVVRPPRN